MDSLGIVAGMVPNEVDFSNWDWANRGTSHVSFASHEELPLREGRNLGHGANGPVYETVIKGVSVAWKRKYCRKTIGPGELKEIEIIKKLRHSHIIRFAGSYTHGRYLGLLLYPVAQCDLATFLEDLDFVLSVKNWPKKRLKGATKYTDERLVRCSEISGVHHETIPHGITKAATARL